jgi:hypothetical protein
MCCAIWRLGPGPAPEDGPLPALFTSSETILFWTVIAALRWRQTRGMNHFSRFAAQVTIFHEQSLPERATPAGHAALIEAYGLKVPLPKTLSAAGEHHRIRVEGGWRILSPRHAPSPDLGGHLTPALKCETEEFTAT